MATFLIRLQRRIYRNRSITFTPIGTRFVLLTLAVGLGAINTGNNLLYLVVGMMLSLIIVSGILSEQSLRRVSLEWVFPSRIFAQQPVSARLRITNGKKRLPSFSFRAEEGDRAAGSAYIFKLSARRTTTLSCTTSFPRRGLSAQPPLMLRTAFPFGFFEKSHVRPQTLKALVYPRVLPLPSGLEAAASRHGSALEHRRRGRGSALYSLRDYTAADDARAIHWKASARKSRLILKEYEREEDRQVLIILSRRVRISEAGSASPESLEDFERAVEMAASLAVESSRRGYALVFRTLTPDGSPQKDAQDLDPILTTLAVLPPLHSIAPEPLSRSISASMIPTFAGPRFLILPFPDPAWDSVRGSCSAVWVANEPLWEEWAARRAGGGSESPMPEVRPGGRP